MPRPRFARRQSAQVHCIPEVRLYDQLTLPPCHCFRGAAVKRRHSAYGPEGKATVLSDWPRSRGRRAMTALYAAVLNATFAAPMASEDKE